MKTTLRRRLDLTLDTNKLRIFIINAGQSSSFNWVKLTFKLSTQIINWTSYPFDFSEIPKKIIIIITKSHTVNEWKSLQLTNIHNRQTHIHTQYSINDVYIFVMVMERQQKLLCVYFASFLCDCDSAVLINYRNRIFSYPHILRLLFFSPSSSSFPESVWANKSSLFSGIEK